MSFDAFGHDVFAEKYGSMEIHSIGGLDYRKNGIPPTVVQRSRQMRTEDHRRKLMNCCIPPSEGDKTVQSIRFDETNLKRSIIIRIYLLSTVFNKKFVSTNVFRGES